MCVCADFQISFTELRKRNWKLQAITSSIKIGTSTQKITELFASAEASCITAR